MEGEIGRKRLRKRLLIVYQENKLCQCFWIARAPVSFPESINSRAHASITTAGSIALLGR